MKVPPNVLENIEARLAKVARYLKRQFGNEKSLDQAIKDSQLLPDKNNNISVDDFEELRSWNLQRLDNS